LLVAHSFLSVEKDDKNVLPHTDRQHCSRKCHTGDPECLLRKPKLRTLVTFGLSSFCVER